MKASSTGRSTLREATQGGPIEASLLSGWIGGQKVTILAILNNTAVYVRNNNLSQKFIESLEKIEIKKSDIKLLPIKENLFGYRSAKK